ncbi:hypothetical protein JG687_00014740, partial [Phytophthora cactorum]
STLPTHCFLDFLPSTLLTIVVSPPYSCPPHSLHRVTSPTGSSLLQLLTARTVLTAGRWLQSKIVGRVYHKLHQLPAAFNVTHPSSRSSQYRGPAWRHRVDSLSTYFTLDAVISLALFAVGAFFTRTASELPSASTKPSWRW